MIYYDTNFEFDQIAKKNNTAHVDHMFDQNGGNLFDVNRDKARPGNFWLRTLNSMFRNYIKNKSKQ